MSARIQPPAMQADETERLADEIRAVATIASGLAARMLRHARRDKDLRAHAGGMAGAAIIMRGWAAAIKRRSVS